jgi:3-deoxy-D-manno-octulosonic-acid transferase
LKIKGIYLLYRLLQVLGFPLVLLYLLLRSVRRRAYRASLKQRFGFLPASFKQTVPGSIWLHAVSVGEVTAALELVRQLRRRLPRSPVFVSVSTLAGHATAVRRMAGLAEVFYAPVDYVFAVRRVLRRLQPALVIIMETEIWPNLFREARRTQAGLLMVNGRISDRALGRYAGWRWFFSGVLALPQLLLAQGEEMRQRLIRIGAPADKVKTGGNLKYDFEAREAAPDSPVRQFIARARPAAVWIAASTMPPASAADPDEDEEVIGAFQQVAARRADLLLVLAPRKPERFDEAARKLERAGVRFVRRSALEDSAGLALPGALLLDSIGELSGLFALADVVFMGGSLAARGGHNILEPAVAARPVISGPHLENFAEIAAEFRAAGALVEVGDRAGLADAVTRLLEQPAWAADLGARAQRCAKARQGAAAAAAAAAHQIFSSHVPRYRPPQPALAFRWMLSRLWLWGGAWKQRRALARRRKLDIPVISVGNLTAGGTGKTPVVLYLAEHLRQAGYTPGILTRGHGRHSPYRHEALAAGAHSPAERTGDEPQMFLRAGVAPVGIGPDRWHAGRLLINDFGVDVLLLDDGFQHVRLERQADLVLIDALNPLGGGYPLPLGRLREPLEALRRASLFIITRSDFGRVNEGLEHLLRRYNPHAPVLHARVRPRAWIAHATGESTLPEALPFTRVAAFCGLGNPESFWQTLAELRVPPVRRLTFNDHHAYKPTELRYLSHYFREAGAQAVLTTEKDMINLCEGSDALLAPLPLYWLRIGVEMDDPQRLTKALPLIR